MNNYISRYRTKYYLKAHLIFVCKYRKKLLTDSIDELVKETFNRIASRSDFDIEILETDTDHIHMLISYPPHISVTSIVRRLKQESTLFLWNNYSEVLKRHFWNEHTFWSDGYFVCSICEANPDTVRRYIENQG